MANIQAGLPSIIKSIQTIAITIAANGSNGSAACAAVNTAKSVLQMAGTGAPTAHTPIALAFLSSASVQITTAGTQAGAVTYSVTIIEYI